MMRGRTRGDGYTMVVESHTQIGSDSKRFTEDQLVVLIHICATYLIVGHNFYHCARNLIPV